MGNVLFSQVSVCLFMGGTNGVHPWPGQDGGYPGMGYPLARDGVLPSQGLGTLLARLGLGVPWDGVPPASDGYPPWLGQDGVPPRIGQHREYLLQGGWYASCITQGDCFVFMQFLRKFGQIIGWLPSPKLAPSSGKSWIRHWLQVLLRIFFSF